MKKAGGATFSPESIRRAIRRLLVAAAGLATLALVLPSGGARAASLRVAGLLLLLDAALVVYYGARFGRAFLEFLMRRLCLMLVTLIGITLVVFVVVRFAPGDPVSAQGDLDGSGDASGIGRELDISRARAELLGSQAQHTYGARAADPDGDRVRLEFDWGDETPLERSPEVASDTTVELAHSWRGPGNYPIRVRAIDEHGARSAWSEPLRVEAREGESLPAPPGRPQGSIAVDAGTTADYTVDATGLSEDVTVYVDWGDGSTPRPAKPGDEAGTRSRPHMWRAGIFQVRARSVDARGAVSDWTEPLEVAVFETDSSLAGPELSVARDHARTGTSLTFRARAVSRGAPELRFQLRVREEDAPPDAPREEGGARVARSGEVVELTHVFLRPGTYLVDVSARDAGVSSPPRYSDPVRVTIDGNGPPLPPARPQGPARTRVETTIIEQYLKWLSNVARLDFGRSHKHLRPVWPLIWEERLPTTMTLSALSLLLAYLIAIPIGVYSSTHRGSFLDRCLGVTVFTLYSLPSFWVATMVIAVATDFPRVPIRHLACGHPSAHPIGPDGQVPLLGICLAGVAAALVVRFGGLARLPAGLVKTLGAFALLSAGVSSVLFLPRGELTRVVLLAAVPLLCGLLVLGPSRGDEPRERSVAAAAGVAAAALLVLVFLVRLLTFDLFWHALLPVACLTYGGLAALSRYTRSGMLDVVRQDYVRTARAKGLPERTVIFKHALRNGLIPVVTLFATVLPQLIGGSVIIETIFSIEGMGLLMVESVRDRDYNVIMAVTTLTAVMTLLGLLLSDVLYVVIDPRIRFDRRTAA